MVFCMASLPAAVPVVGFVLGGGVWSALASSPGVLGAVLGAVRVAAAAGLGWEWHLGVASPLSRFCAKLPLVVAVGVAAVVS